MALRTGRLLDETRRRAEEMAALAEVGREMSAMLDLSRVLELVARGGAIVRFADGQIAECWNLPSELHTISS